ncbi:hypothetical protein PUN28_008141 [Cardiocondyla obscurior]|uniref:Secreted protein n=1 Tax=Cardiocondyla obscurior TaxID=286306 RepID=A0AAW2FWC4_9HYME
MHVFAYINAHKYARVHSVCFFFFFFFFYLNNCSSPFFFCTSLDIIRVRISVTLKFFGNRKNSPKDEKFSLSLSLSLFLFVFLSLHFNQNEDVPTRRHVQRIDSK